MVCMPATEAATQLYTQPPEPKASSVRRVQTQLWEPCLTLRLSPRSRTSGTRILRVQQHVRPLHPPLNQKSSPSHILWKSNIVNESSVMKEEEGKNWKSERMRMKVLLVISQGPGSYSSQKWSTGARAPYPLTTRRHLDRGAWSKEIWICHNICSSKHESGGTTNKAIARKSFISELCISCQSNDGTTAHSKIELLLDLHFSIMIITIKK